MKLGKIAFYFCAVVSLSRGSRSETVLDVLILYTDDVESYYSGTEGVFAHVYASFASANIAFENSDVAIRLRARAIEKTDYWESSHDMDSDLDFITESAAIANLRNDVGADLVCLFRNGSTDDAVGIAWLLEDSAGKAPRGFSVTSAQAANSTFVFQHEIGHNLGGAHDRDNSEGGGLYSYSYGYRFDASNSVQYRTVMAYAPGQRINHFSNPEISYEGTPTGIASGVESADNAKGFNGIASTIDAYRSHVHRLPIANAGGDIRSDDFNRSGDEDLTLDGSGSSAEGQIVSWEWSWTGGSASGEIVSGTFPLGETLVTLTVTDDDGYTSQATARVNVLELSPIKIFEAGYEHGLFVHFDGTVLGVGVSGEGSLGFRSYEPQSTPVKVFSGDIKVVSAGWTHTLYIMSDGSAWGVGRNSGALGDGTTDSRTDPFRVFDSGAAEVSAGRSHSLFLLDDGSAWASGSNQRAQLGDGTYKSRNSPVRIFESGIVAIAAGGDHSLWVKTDGSLWLAGHRAHTPSDRDPTIPFMVMPSGVSTVSTGWENTLIVKTDGSLWAMGENGSGQLGDGSWSSRELPVKVMDSGVLKAAAGRKFSLVLKTDGSLWQMGEDLFPRDVEGNELGTWFPVPVVSSNVVDISVADEHAFYRTDDGSIWAIGKNEDGQLGSGDLVDRWEPIVVLSSSGRIENMAPIANLGDGIVAFDHNGDGFTTVELDGSASYDDWFIKNFVWEWGEKTSQGKMTSSEFEEGLTEVMLTVTDNEGISNSDTFFVLVADPAVYRQARLLNEGKDRLLKMDVYSDLLRYTLWGSEDLNEWFEMDFESFQRDEAFLFKLEGDSSRFFRVEISE